MLMTLTYYFFFRFLKFLLNKAQKFVVSKPTAVSDDYLCYSTFAKVLATCTNTTYSATLL